MILAAVTTYVVLGLGVFGLLAAVFAESDDLTTKMLVVASVLWPAALVGIATMFVIWLVTQNDDERVL